MFTGSYGSIAQPDCTNQVFSVNSYFDLKASVKTCLEQSSKGDCPNGPFPLIGEWDVSVVIDFGRLFFDANTFNSDISKWDVSSANNMDLMFCNAYCSMATSLNGTYHV